MVDPEYNLKQDIHRNTETGIPMSQYMRTAPRIALDEKYTFDFCAKSKDNLRIDKTNSTHYAKVILPEGGFYAVEFESLTAHDTHIYIKNSNGKDLAGENWLSNKKYTSSDLVLTSGVYFISVILRNEDARGSFKIKLIDTISESEEGKYIEFGAEEKDNGAATAKGKIEVKLSKSAYTYTGEQIQPLPAVTYKYYTKDANGNYASKAKSMKLVNNVDYVLSYSDNVKASQNKPVVTVTGIGDYSGTISTNFIINKKNANKLTMNPIEDIEAASLTPAATEYIKSQVVVFDGVEVVDPSDYTVNVTQTADNKGNKIADVTITPAANGNYTGDAKKAHTTLYLVSDKISISSNNITITKADNRKPFVYDGKQKKQKLIVTDKATGKKISPKNYKVVYENNINATTKDNKAYVYVIGKGDYFGKKC